MKRMIVLSVIAVLVVTGCGDGGSGIGTNANATSPTVLNAGVAKDVYVDYAVGNRSYLNFTGEITSIGNVITLTEDGKNHVFIGAKMAVYER